MNAAVKYMYLHFNTQEIIFNSKTIIGVYSWQCTMRYITFLNKLYISLHIFTRGNKASLKDKLVYME